MLGLRYQYSWKSWRVWKLDQITCFYIQALAQLSIIVLYLLTRSPISPTPPHPMISSHHVYAEAEERFKTNYWHITSSYLLLWCWNADWSWFPRPGLKTTVGGWGRGEWDCTRSTGEGFVRDKMQEPNTVLFIHNINGFLRSAVRRTVPPARPPVYARLGAPDMVAGTSENSPVMLWLSNS